jgi:hypothetical protein
MAYTELEPSQPRIVICLAPETESQFGRFTRLWVSPETTDEPGEYKLFLPFQGHPETRRGRRVSRDLRQERTSISRVPGYEVRREKDLEAGRGFLPCAHYTRPAHLRRRVRLP